MLTTSSQDYGSRPEAALLVSPQLLRAASFPRNNLVAGTGFWLACCPSLFGCASWPASKRHLVLSFASTPSSVFLPSFFVWPQSQPTSYSTSSICHHLHRWSQMNSCVDLLRALHSLLVPFCVDLPRWLKHCFSFFQLRHPLPKQIKSNQISYACH